MEVLIGKSTSPFSIAMFDYQRVVNVKVCPWCCYVMATMKLEPSSNRNNFEYSGCANALVPASVETILSRSIQHRLSYPEKCIGMHWVWSFGFICTLVGNLNWKPLATLQDFSAYRWHQTLVRSFLVLRAQCNRIFCQNQHPQQRSLHKCSIMPRRACPFFSWLLYPQSFPQKAGSCNHPKQIDILFGINNAIPQKPVGCN